jgi:hypothetical protein
MKRVIIVFTAALALSGCTALQALNGTASQVAPDSVATAKKALTAAHDLHRGVADFLTVAATTNLCHAACAVQAKKWLDDSETALTDADKLLVLGDAPGVEAKVALATSLVGEIQSQIGKN